jgi:tetratricopeptide (TPR) repeat protein
VRRIQFSRPAGRGIDNCNKGIRLSPRDPIALYFLYLGKGAARQIEGRYEESAEWLRRAIAHAPQIPTTFQVLTASLALGGHESEAREMFERSLALGIKIKSIAALKSAFSRFWSSNDPVSVLARERVYQGLRKAGMPEE